MKRYAPTKSFRYTLLLFYAGFRWMTCGLFVFGVIAEILFLIRFFTGGGLSAVMDAPFEDSKDYKQCVMGVSYLLREDLERLQRTRQEYYDEQRQAWKRIILGMIILLAGIGLTSFSAAMIAGLPWFTGGFFTVLVEFTGIAMMFRAYLDADFPLAKKISESFMILSLPIKIERTAKMIAALTKRIREEDQKSLSNS